MRVAALYDIHGHLPALEAVLAEVDKSGADTILVGGDFATGPMGAEATDLLRSLGERARFIRGNAERELWAPGPVREGGPPPESLEWARRQLGDERIRFLRSLPETVTFDVDGLGRVLFCHATPRDDEEIVTVLTPDERVREVLAGVEERVVVCGHTHVQDDRQVGAIRLANAGSVGMPYEDEPGAYWAILGPDVELRRTEFDAEEAKARIAATGFSDEIPTASRREASEYFEQLAQERR
ncbi:MAG TPA: metallophosphoesterase family protein [Gaiellaceae bacterium]